MSIGGIGGELFSGFRYTVEVQIERLHDPENRGPVRLPVVFESEDLLTRQQIAEQARTRASEFLNMLQDTAPAHRGDYGGIIRDRVVSVVQVVRGQELR